MKILVGVAGSIAAYRSPDFVKELVKLGHQVRVVLTKGAENFVTAKTLETFSGGLVAGPNPFSNELSGTDHIEWSRWADAIFVYGATANFLGRLANGLGEDFLSLQILAFKGSKVFLAPAMNTAMWDNPLVQQNVRKLQDSKYQFVGPIAGDLACGETGLGHIATHPEMIAAITSAENSKQNRSSDSLSVFRNKKVLVSGGPMRSLIDPVRFLQNSSSGDVAVNLAKEFQRLGAEVTVLLGPVDSENVKIAQASSKKLLRFQDYNRYSELLVQEFPKADIFLSAAAVLDFDVKAKIVKTSRAQMEKQSSMQLDIAPTEDLVEKMVKARTPQQRVIAFALETGNLEKAGERALEKLKTKGCDAIILNLAENILNSESKHFQQWLIQKNGQKTSIEGSSKAQLAQHLVKELEAFLVSPKA